MIWESPGKIGEPWEGLKIKSSHSKPFKCNCFPKIDIFASFFACPPTDSKTKIFWNSTKCWIRKQRYIMVARPQQGVLSPCPRYGEQESFSHVRCHLFFSKVSTDDSNICHLSFLRFTLGTDDEADEGSATQHTSLCLWLTAWLVLWQMWQSYSPSGMSAGG